MLSCTAILLAQHGSTLMRLAIVWLSCTSVPRLPLTQSIQYAACVLCQLVTSSQVVMVDTCTRCQLRQREAQACKERAA